MKRRELNLNKKRNWWKLTKRYVHRSKKDPESLSRGLGLGLFVGFLPSVGLQVVVAFFVASFLNANRIVAVLGTLVTNPFTTLPISVFSVWLGDVLLPGSTLASYSFTNFEWKTLLSSSDELLYAYLAGCLALAIVGGVIGYSGMRVYCAATAHTKR